MSGLRFIWGLSVQVIRVDEDWEPGFTWTYVYLVDHGRKKWLRLTRFEAVDAGII